MDLTNLGKSLRARRIALGLTQREIGEVVGVTFQYISELEKGTDKTTLRTLLQVARALRAELRIALVTDDPGPLTEEEQRLISRYRAMDDAGRATVEQLAGQWQTMDHADTRTLRGMLDLWKRSMSYADSSIDASKIAV